MRDNSVFESQNETEIKNEFDTIDSEIKNQLDKIINYFPKYQNIMYRVFTTSQNLSCEINFIKKEIFDDILVIYHHEVLKYITYIITNIQQKYKSNYFLALPDFIDLIYQNAFYDIFSVKFQELEFVNPEKITENHLLIFNLIIYAEHIKYKLYSDFETKNLSNQSIKNTLEKRKNNSLLRINVCCNLLENHQRITDANYDYLNIIDKYKFFTKDNEYTEKFFKDIN
jgi:hypothetical protein